MPDSFSVEVADRVLDDLRSIAKRYGAKTYGVLRDLILDLAVEPEKKGEPLRGPLRGLYSRHYSRFRIIYHIDKGHLVVLVVGAGFHQQDSRADIYKAIERLISSGTIAIPPRKDPGKPDQN